MKEPCFPNGKSKIFGFLLRNFRCFHALLLLPLLCLPFLSLLSRKGVAEMLILWQTEESRIHGHAYAHITNIYRSRAPTPCTPALSTYFLLSLLLQYHPRKKRCDWIVEKSIHYGRNVPLLTATGHDREDIICQEQDSA